MPIKPVFKAEFEGDVFEIIEVAGAYHYRQKSGSETIIEGQTPFLAIAMQTLFAQMTSWANDVDEGHTVCSGLSVS